MGTSSWVQMPPYHEETRSYCSSFQRRVVDNEGNLTSDNRRIFQHRVQSFSRIYYVELLAPFE